MKTGKRYMLGHFGLEVENEYGEFEPLTPYHRDYRPVNLEGRPVERTKEEAPYSYSEFVVWRNGPNKEMTDAVYTDRLHQWDSDKFRRLCEKYLPRYRWDNAPEHAVTAFLREWMEDPTIRVLAVVEWCNWATGYPTWSLHYKKGKDVDDRG